MYVGVGSLCTTPRVGTAVPVGGGIVPVAGGAAAVCVATGDMAIIGLGTPAIGVVAQLVHTNAPTIVILMMLLTHGARLDCVFRDHM